ncbi:Hypothetical predicted protein [Olea europaea subsp. europaea]|uniref:Pentatricopeptide repeat-containing protein n=1 Tax=Olea europaea subsp. europaea TaxID=158383 RepID=A0A8S0TEV9_OLEEU|nr:Hypothetical predicted protein [Olea europaea subsp. europaea]
MNRHARLIKLGLDANAIHATKLINGCSLSHEHQVFDRVLHKDTNLWTALISAYARSELSQYSQSIGLFSLMTRDWGPDARRNHFTFTTVARVISSAPEHIFTWEKPSMDTSSNLRVCTFNCSCVLFLRSKDVFIIKETVSDI